VIFYLDGVATAPLAYGDLPFTFNAPAYIGAWQIPRIRLITVSTADELAVSLSASQAE
jgi:hypothetical protein